MKIETAVPSVDIGIRIADKIPHDEMSITRRDDKIILYINTKDGIERQDFVNAVNAVKAEKREERRAYAKEASVSIP